MYNINIPGIPDLSNIDFSQFNIPGIAPPPGQQAPAPVYDNPLPQLDFSNIDLSQFNVPQPAPAPVPAPVPEPALAPVPVFDPSQFVAPVPAPAPTPTPEPTPAPAPEFDPYVGMTLADLAEIGMVAPLSQTLPAPAPAPQPSAPTGIETMAPNFQMTEDFALPVDQQQLMPATTPVTPTPAPAPQPVAPSGVDFNPNSPAMNAETLMGTPDIPTMRDTEPTGFVGGIVAGQYSTPTVNNVAQSLVPSEIFDSEGIPDLSNLDLSGVDLSGFIPPQEAINEAQGTTPAQTTRGGDDLSQIPSNYFTAASNYYTDGQLADMGMEPGTVVSTGANPQQPAGTQIEITPEQQAAIDNFLANNPAGSVVQTPFGNISLPQLSNYTQGNASPNTNTRAAEFVVQNLTIQQNGTQGRGGQVATEYALSRGAPAPAQGGNPFRRPTDGGIASLVPSGG